MKDHSTLLSHPKYRPDIDGLRAVAVLSVVGFHAFPNQVTGGFTGVDIFFVISGFLISTILFENLQKGTFSFSEFYARRIHRIFPALILVLAASYAFGWFALLAGEYKQFGKHTAGGAGFISNLLFWSESGYFDNSAETKPLLHLWSLGIEEQFYIVWPLMLWAAWKSRISPLKLSLLVFLASLLLSIRTTSTDAVAAFYSLQTRMWELLCGGVLAALTTLHKEAFSIRKGSIDASIGRLAGRVPGSGAITLSNLASWVGVALIGMGTFLLDRFDHFPGAWALLPTLGTALVISAGPGAWVNRKVLTNRVLVWFGLISFPLYLWHWPLLSFARVIGSGPPSRTVRISAVALAITMAWLTYALIEKPLRSFVFGRVKTPALVLTMLVVGSLGFATYVNEGFPLRSHAVLKGYEGDIGHIEFHQYIADNFFMCTPARLAREALRWEGYVRCMQSRKDANVEIALVGDSHAEHLFIGLAEALPDKNVAFYIKGSPPFVGNDDFASIYQELVRSRTIKKVILTMWWAIRADQVPAGSTLEQEVLRVAHMLQRAGKEVYITDDVPWFPFSPERCKGRRWLAPPQVCDIDLSASSEQLARFRHALDSVVASDGRIKLLKTYEDLCTASGCAMTKGKFLLYRDQDHLNINGSRLVGRAMVEANREEFKD